MPIADFSAQQADSPLASAAECARRATRALEQLDAAQCADPHKTHDLRACLGTLVAGMQVLDQVPADSDLAAEARDIVQRHARRIDELLAPAG